MKSITTSLALSQLQKNRKRTALTIIGIVLSVAMITAVFGLAASGIDAMRNLVGEGHVSSYRSVFVSLSAVLGAIIMAASVIVISNAFRISAAERLKQFGILKSVGATRQQITKTVLREALFLSIVSIPAGIILGMLLHWLGTTISDTLLAPMNKLIEDGLSLHMQFVFSWEALLIAVSLSFGTVMLSAFLPARKAAAIPAIAAIRLTPEIKLSSRKPRRHRLVRAVFGFEGMLAAKAMKRSKRSYRAMVTALTISVVLFLVCGGLETQMTMTMNNTYENIDATSITYYHAEQSDPALQGGPLDSAAAQRLTEQLADYPDTTVYGVGRKDTYVLYAPDAGLTDTMMQRVSPDDPYTEIVLVMPDTAHYQALCKLAGVPEGSNILINSYRQIYNDKVAESEPVHFSKQTFTLKRNGETTTLPLHGQLTSTQIPQELMESAFNTIAVVVPQMQATMYNWYASSIDTEGFVAHAEAVMRAFVPEGDRSVYGVTDITEITDMTRGLTKLISVFLYGFVGMLSLIGLTSILSAIAANVRLRAREFAVLVSVGMTQGGVRKMLALESVISACKALLYGIPLGSLAMYLTYITLTQNVSYGFIYPWNTVLMAVAAVFLIALIATQYAASKLRGNSTMEVIRSTEGI